MRVESNLSRVFEIAGDLVAELAAMRARRHAATLAVLADPAGFPQSTSVCCTARGNAPTSDSDSTPGLRSTAIVDPREQLGDEGPMSSLYCARVEQVAPPKVSLTVWQIHPDAETPPESVTFALALICAPFRKALVLKGSVSSARSPLAQAIDIEGGKDADRSWMVENARAFMASVSRKSIKNVPPKASLEWPPPYDRDFAPLPQAVFEIVATDPAWVSHLKPGLSWRTAAYDMGKARPATARHPGGKAAARSELPSSATRERASPTRARKATKKEIPSRKRAASARRLEFVRATSKKFWEVELKGRILVTRYGRLGAVPRETKKSFANTADARGALEKLVAEKITKGYREV